MDEEIARIRQDYEILRGTEHAKNNMIEVVALTHSRSMLLVC